MQNLISTIRYRNREKEGVVMFILEYCLMEIDNLVCKRPKIPKTIFKNKARKHIKHQAMVNTLVWH